MTLTPPVISLPECGFLTQSEAQVFVPTIHTAEAFRVWLWRRRDTVRRKHGKVLLSDILNEVANGH